MGTTQLMIFQSMTKISLMIFKLATKISLMMFKLATKTSPKTHLRTASMIQASASATRKTETAKPGLPQIRKSAATKDGGAKRSPKTAQRRVVYASQKASQKTNQKTNQKKNQKKNQTTSQKTNQKKSQRRKTASMTQAFAFATRKTETVKLGLPPIRKSAAAKSGRETRSLTTAQGLVTLVRSDENTKRGSFDTDSRMSNVNSNPLVNIIVCEYI